MRIPLLWLAVCALFLAACNDPAEPRTAPVGVQVRGSNFALMVMVIVLVRVVPQMLAAA